MKHKGFKYDHNLVMNQGLGYYSSINKTKETLGKQKKMDSLNILRPKTFAYFSQLF